MARQTYLTTDPASLKPIAEALIFASEEPLAARLLVRFLTGEKEEGGKGDAGPGNGEIPDDAAAAGENVETTDVETTESGTTEGAPDSGDTGVGQDEDAVSGEADVDEPGASSTDEPDTAEQFPADSSENAGELAEAIERAEDRASGMLVGEGFGEPIDQRLLRRLIDELNAEYQESGRAFRIVEIAGGFQFATIREYGEYVALLSKEKSRRRLSPAALETLAIIAYRQPVSKPELESIRGVNSDQVLLSLLEKNLIAITGRADSVGRPLLYGTTSEFLRIFGLNSLSDLPRLREIEELMEEDAYSADRVEVITVAESSEVEEIEARVGAAGRSEEESESRESGVESHGRGDVETHSMRLSGQAESRGVGVEEQPAGGEVVEAGDGDGEAAVEAENEGEGNEESDPEELSPIEIDEVDNSGMEINVDRSDEGDDRDVELFPTPHEEDQTGEMNERHEEEEFPVRPGEIELVEEYPGSETEESIDSDESAADDLIDDRLDLREEEFNESGEETIDEISPETGTENQEGDAGAGHDSDEDSKHVSHNHG